MKPVSLVAGGRLAAFLVCAGASSADAARRRRGRRDGAAVYGTGVIQLPNLEHLIRTSGRRWAVDLPARRRHGLPGDRRVRRPDRAGGDDDPRRRRRRRAGQDQHHRAHRDRLGLRGGGRPHELLPRPQARPRVPRQRHGPKVKITDERLEQVERFFDRHGGKAILIGRFVGLVRAVAPFLAGSSRMPLRRFLPYDIIGAGLWGTTFCLLGYIFWQSFDQARDYAEAGRVRARHGHRRGRRRRLALAVAARGGEPRGAHDWLRSRPSGRCCGRSRACCGRRRPRQRPARRASCGSASRPATSASRSPPCSPSRRSALRLLRATFTSGRATRRSATGAFDAGRRLAPRGSSTWPRRSRPRLDPVVARARVTARASLLSRRGAGRSRSRAGLALTVTRRHVTKAIVDRPRPPDPLVDATARLPVGARGQRGRLGGDRGRAPRVLPGSPRAFVVVTVGIVIAVAVGLRRASTCARTGSPTCSGAGRWRAMIYALCGVVGAGRRLHAPESGSPTHVARMTRPGHLRRRRRARRARPDRLRRAHPRARVDEPTSRVWERLAAAFLSLYVLAAFVGVGVAGGAAIIWFWDRIGA